MLQKLINSQMENKVKIILIEPFYSGSHKLLMDTLIKHLPADETLLFTMKGIKWPWRARCSALYFYQNLPINLPSSLKTLFVSCVLNLAELVALRPDLQKLKKIIYFHENQLVYPKQKDQQRDFQYGYNQVLSCLVADKIIFNSEFNMKSFLQSMRKFFKLMPDNRPKDLESIIQSKSSALYFPIEFPILKSFDEEKFRKLRIVWPHRWEHDKDPETFLNTMMKLKMQGIEFKLSVLGQNYSEVPEIFEKARIELADNIEQWGFVEDRDQYWNILNSSNVVISTAKHEFFGVAMIEAAYAKCYPLCPNDLVYPEIFPGNGNVDDNHHNNKLCFISYLDECLYKNADELLLKLINLSKNLNHNLEINFKRFDLNELFEEYRKILYEN